MEIIKTIIGGIFSIKAAQFILSLSFLIILHELGHFLPAKFFKTKVEKFYLFFDPWFSLFKFKKGETEYGIGWIPLGGYVKIAGMIDESMDKEQMKLEPQDWEFRSKPAWQRLIIMVGGVVVNLILAMLIYMATLFIWGESYIPNKNLKDGVWCSDPMAKELGFENGDKFITINGEEVENFSDIMMKLITAKEAVVERNNELKTIVLPQDFIEKLVDSGKKSTFFMPRTPFKVGDVMSESGAEKGGLLHGDSIMFINGEAVRYFDQFSDLLSLFKGQIVNLEVRQHNETRELQVQVSDSGKIGFQAVFYSVDDMSRMGILEIEKKEYSFFESIPGGINKAISTLDGYIDQFKLIVNPETGAYKGLGGFATIGNMFPDEWDWQAFWERTAFLSVILAFMNILPIPALDGGHVMFLLYEIIFRRKPNEKFMEYAQLAGMLLLLALMLFANGNDIFRLFK